MRRSRALTLPFSLALLAIGCQPVPIGPALPTNDAIIEAPREGGDLESRPFSDEERAQSKGKLGGVWVQCYRAFQPAGDASNELAHLAAMCGKSTGLRPLTPPRTGETQSESDPTDRFVFRVRPGHCYRVFAVGSPEVVDLDVAILDAKGHLVAADLSHDKFPVVPPRGPLCFDQAGVYSIEAAVTQGAGTYALQIWADDDE